MMMKKAIGYLGLITAALIMVTAVLTYLAPHLGWRVDLVSTGSMEPRIETGSLLVIRPVDPEEIVIGDVITFWQSGLDTPLVTHRVIDSGHNSPLWFQTKGDANPFPDTFIVPAGNLAGVVWLNLPYLGYGTEFLKTLPGYILGLVLPSLIMAGVLIILLLQTLRQAVKPGAVKVVSG